jgi:hypothetical protein
MSAASAPWRDLERNVELRHTVLRADLDVLDLQPAADKPVQRGVEVREAQGQLIGRKFLGVIHGNGSSG